MALHWIQEERTRELAPPRAGADAAAHGHSEEQPVPLLGGTLAGRYRLVRQVGQGAGGRVYEAVDLHGGPRALALKLLTQAEPQHIYRLKNEFRSLAQLRHANLVSLHALGCDGGRWFVAMDLVRGEDFLAHVRPRGGLDLKRLRAALAQLVRGVAAIHSAGKMHRDLKPSNVLVGEAGRVVIVDFGLVSTQSPGGVGRTRDNWFAGTPAYAAPEQISGEPFDAKADLYAIGVMLYQALTGALPFSGSAERVLQDKLCLEPPALPCDTEGELPLDLGALCAALLAREPEVRPDAAAVLAQLGDASSLPRAAAAPEPCLGRSQELAALEGALAHAHHHGAVVALVHGAEGCGKSLLLRQFAELARREHDAVVLEGCCDAREQVPYRAFDALVDALCRQLATLSEAEAASLMPRDAALIARLFPTLARLPALRRMPLRPRLFADETLARGFAIAALKELLARMADRRPLLLGFDDVHWDDAESGALLRELVREPGAPAALFVCVYRDDQRAASAMLRGLHEASPALHELALEPWSKPA